MKKVILVHGFNVRDGGARTVDQLAPGLAQAGYLVDKDEADYGYFGLWDIRFRNGDNRRRVLHRLANTMATSDYVITHSNGAYFTTLALRMMPLEIQRRVTVVHISPAMNRNTEPPMAVKRMKVMFTPHDGWGTIAGLSPFSPWGAMGAYGYSGQSRLVTNQKHIEIRGHSDWFLPRHINRTLESALHFIREY